jgi:hypothetical protein
VAANKDIGARIEKIRGISNEVNSIKIEIEIPSEAIKSRNRNDCDNQMIDIKEKLTNRNPIIICFVMYKFSFFIKGDYNRFILDLKFFMCFGFIFVNIENNLV